jgi:transcription antitermination factor NusG
LNYILDNKDVMTLNWYALHVKPHKERMVYQLLETREVEAFLPSLKVKPVNPRSAKERPYFPGYLFVRADLAVEGTDAYRWLPGVHGLVRMGGEPAVVQEGLIAEVQAHLRKIEAAGGLNLVDMKPGEKVLITEGPFNGYEAIFDAYLPGDQRVRVLLAFLSRQPQPVNLDASDIRKKK